MTRPPLVEAGALLLVIVAIGAFLRVLDSPWYVWGLLWLYAVKWVLILVFDLPRPERSRHGA